MELNCQCMRITHGNVIKQIGATVTSEANFEHSDWIYKKSGKCKIKRNMKKFELKISRSI